MNKSFRIITLICVFIIVISYFYWDNRRQSQTLEPITATATQAVILPPPTVIAPTTATAKPVVLLIPNSTDSANKSLLEGAISAAGEAGLHLEVVDYKQDQNQLLSRADKALREGSLAVIIYSSDNAAIQSVLSKANQAGIPVVMIAGSEGIQPAANVTFDFADGAAQAARLLCKAIRNQGDVAVLTAENSPESESVSQQFRDNMETTCPDAAIKNTAKVKNTAADAGLAFSDLLAQNPEIEAVFATNSDLLTGASMAAIQAGRPGIAMVGFDDGETLVKSIGDGKFTALITSSWKELGMAAIKTVSAISHGEKVSSQIMVPVRAMTGDPGLDLPPDSTAKQLKIGVILPNVDPPFYNQVFQGLKIPAFALDGVKLDVYSLQDKPEVLLKDAELLINKKASALLIVSLDPVGVNEVVRRANQAGIPIFIMGAKPSGGQTVTYFGPDELSAGSQAGTLAWLSKDVGQLAMETILEYLYGHNVRQEMLFPYAVITK